MLSYATATIVALALYLFVKPQWWARERTLSQIPTVGPSQPLLSYLGAIKFLYDAAGMLRRGYERHKPGIFKVAGFNGWTVVVCGEKYIEELRKAPDDVVSFDDAANDVIQIPYTLGKDIMTDPYHIHVLLTQLTRNLHDIFPHIHDEVISAIQDSLSTTNEGEWASMLGLEAMTQIMARVCNRTFVGLPLCRNLDYISLCKTFAMKEVFQAAITITLFPNFLRPVVSYLLSCLSSPLSRATKLLRPVIKQRKEIIKEYGKDCPQNPNDFLQWLLTDSRGSQASDRDLASRILAINFAAVRTPSMIMTQVLFHLIANPEYIQPMRHEVESVINAEGWTRTSVDKMHKLDSFVKETLRFSDIRFLSMMRKTRKQFAFSDSSVIPEGTMVFAASHPTHFDASIYHNPQHFDGFRFERLRQREKADVDDSGPRHQLVATNPAYLSWGYGKHAYPGRFFAAVVLKLILAHLILNYDLRFDQPGARPSDFVFEANCMPNAQARILLKRRKLVA